MDEKRRVLLVEDEKNIALLLAHNLNSSGFETAIAYDGEEGLKKRSPKNLTLCSST